MGVAQSPRANTLFSDVLSATNTCKWSLVNILPDRFSLENGDAAVNSFGERPTMEYDQAFARVSGRCRNRRLSAARHDCHSLSSSPMEDALDWIPL